MKCFKCEKEIEWESDEHDTILDGGRIYFDFGYGSIYDSIGTRRGMHGDESIPRPLRLTDCDRAVGYVCDDCFKAHCDMVEGYEEIPQHHKTRRIM